MLFVVCTLDVTFTLEIESFTLYKTTFTFIIIFFHSITLLFVGNQQDISDVPRPEQTEDPTKGADYGMFCAV